MDGFLWLALSFSKRHIFFRAARNVLFGASACVSAMFCFNVLDFFWRSADLNFLLARGESPLLWCDIFITHRFPERFF